MPAPNLAKEYDARIRRAEHLADVHPFAREVLTFYRRIAEFQKSSLAALVTDSKPPFAELGESSLQENLKLESLLPRFKEFLTLVAEHGPAPLADSAKQLSLLSAKSWAGLLTENWDAGRRDDQPDAAFKQFLPRAFLQPFAELRAAEKPRVESGASASSLCPGCGARPLLGVLRPEGDGGKRFLMCSVCQREWEYRRILCPTCGEEAEAKLPVYVAEQFPYIRVETCDACKFYLPTIDLTKDGNAVPLVDDLAAIPLSLWAAEHGYSRARANLLGT